MGIWMRALMLAMKPSRPSAAIGLVTLGGLWAVVASMLAVSFTVDEDWDLAGLLGVVGLFVLPPASGVFGLGALLNRRWTARGIQLAGVTGMLGLSWLFIGSFYGAEVGALQGMMVSGVLAVLPVGLAATLTVVHAVRAISEVRGLAEELREDWLLTELDLRGWLDADEIDEVTGWDLVRAERVADAANHEATVEGSRLRLDRVAARQRERIIAMVEARGRVPLAELAEVFSETRDAIDVRLTELQEAGALHGYADADAVYSVDLAALQDLGRCPSCAGALDLAGKGLIRCGHCDTVVYL